MVLDLAERKRKQADQLLAQAQSKVQQGEQTLQQLESYYNDYANEFYAAGAKGVSLGQLQTHQAFMQKLRVAIEQQKKALIMERAQLEQVKTYWQKAYGHHQAVDSLVDKIKDEESRVADKQQQKELDERSQLIRPTFI
ncbi:hypothetical protein GCM10007941_23590 [Amphritea balenae]|nr:hypothetical protein GCM10007941_23590 [Amphritea balenae]